MDLIRKNNKRNDAFIDGYEDFFKNFFNLNKSMNMKTDIQEYKDKYIIEVDVPGLEKQDIDLNLEDGYLNICINKCDEYNEKDKKYNYLRRERHCGCQCRSFYIGEVNEDHIHAYYENGTLTINIPKKDISVNSTCKRIEIDWFSNLPVVDFFLQ